MKHIITLLIAVLSFVAVSAQTQSHSIVIDEHSFAPVQTDIMSGVAIDKIQPDNSRRPCARIKMHVNRMSSEEIDALSVRPVGGSVVIMKQMVASEGNGLIIELTAKQPTRFYLHSDKYGDSNEVSLNLEGDKEYKLSAQLNVTRNIFVVSDVVDAEVYIDGDFKGRTNDHYTLTVMDVVPGMHTLIIKYGSVVARQEIEVTGDNLDFRLNVNTVQSRPQYVVFAVNPTNAVVVIDKKNYVPDSSGVVSLRLLNGSYNYEVRADEYYGESGSFVVSGAKVERTVTLKPAYGWFEMMLEDADVYVDNKHIGKSPISRHKLASGDHNIMVVKELYQTLESTVTIEDGKVFIYEPTLAADFAMVTLDAGKGCDIYVNDERKGASPWSGKLATGIYVIEARKEGHRATMITQNISANPATQSYKLDAPMPIMGAVNVVSNPSLAEVFIDGRLVGKTPLLYDVIIGQHDVEVKIAGYESSSHSVNIVENQEIEIRAMLDRVGGAAGFASNSQVVNGHEWVDLGLGVKWATCNIGASTPEEYGDYFAWGETKPKSSYTQDNSTTNGLGLKDIAGDPLYDAATVNWRGGWRMPTKEDINDLKERCTWMPVTKNGVAGMCVTGPNGNSIFLPAAGYRFGTSSGDVGSCGYCCCSTPYEGDDHLAYSLFFFSGDHDWNESNRYFGQSIRPVLDNVSVTGRRDCADSATTRQYTNDYEWVDLGLSVKWATCNVGATSPEEFGDYFAWGETNPKKSYPAATSVTYGKKMRDITNNLQYDAATANWGNGWRMPTKAEIKELKDRCTWSWTTINGVCGMSVVGPNGRSIFLPAAGYRSGASGSDVGVCGYYSCSAPYEMDYDRAYSVFFFNEDQDWNESNRYFGQSIRPVLDK